MCLDSFTCVVFFSFGRRAPQTAIPPPIRPLPGFATAFTYHGGARLFVCVITAKLRLQRYIFNRILYDTYACNNSRKRE